MNRFWSLVTFKLRKFYCRNYLNNLEHVAMTQLFRENTSPDKYLYQCDMRVPDLP